MRHALKWRLMSRVAVAGLLTLASGTLLAQAFPSKPIRIIVPFSPGSGTDIHTRIAAEGMADVLKQPVIVENREGAGGAIGTQLVARAPADGYTLGHITNAFLINSVMPKKPLYDAMRDFVPVARQSMNPLALLVGADSQFRTFRQLIDFMKANPGKLSFATSGVGAQSHLEVEFIKGAFGRLQAQDVPYKSTVGATTDTITGVVAFYMTGFATTYPQIAAGKLRALAVGSLTREADAPDVPTFVEATGIAGYAPASWFGYVAPAGTPADVVATLEASILKTMNGAVAREKTAKQRSKLWLAGSKEFEADLRVEYQRWAKLVDELNLKTD
jgi:tripartite-type tricarboxylate transporter receptor subunit TctC